MKQFYEKKEKKIKNKYLSNNNKLFKRDFAGEIMDRHPGMKIIDYGFSYRRDPKFPQDDITWFLMEKS